MQAKPIHKVFEESGLTLDAAAAEAGISYATFRKWVRYESMPRQGSKGLDSVLQWGQSRGLTLGCWAEHFYGVAA